MLISLESTRLIRANRFASKRELSPSRTGSNRESRDGLGSIRPCPLVDLESAAAESLQFPPSRVEGFEAVQVRGAGAFTTSFS
jgi:hypothetical protein